MPIKTILLPLRESDMSEHMLESGMLAAKAHGAHLDVLYVHPKPGDMIPFQTIGLTRGMRETVESSATRSSAEQAARLRELFSKVRERHGLPERTRRDYDGGAAADWSEARGVRSVEVARRGRLADLMLTPRPQRGEPPPKTFEAILRETGRPVIMLPRGRASGPARGNVVIGWNASTEAASAVAAARPVLRAAKRVTVLISEKRRHQRPHGRDVVDYLHCHGIAADDRVVDMSRGPVGATLLAQCRDLEAELLVIGGYSRTRMQEMFLGGVTRYLIGAATLPVFMVH